tara:strand:- start:337 stop:585 length:249 start_codon:yes stop_codon:yes gene_type:complete
MPYGNPQAYKSGYIMGQMAKHGAVSEVNEAQLYREKNEFGPGIKQGTLTEDFPSESGSKHMGQSGMIMAADKQQGINSLEPK